jgi:hypothetical protein
VRQIDHIAPGSYTLALQGGPAPQTLAITEGGDTLAELP